MNVSAVGQRAEFTLSVQDDQTRLPLDCRLEIRNEKGLARSASDDVPFWYDANAIPGKVRMMLPLGTYPMNIERGLEYLPRTGHFVLNRNARDAQTVTLRRFVDMSQKGWWSADMTVLRHVNEVEQLMKSDDVHFVPLLTSADLPAAQSDTPPERWFDSDRVYTLWNRELRTPECAVSVLNLSANLDLEKFLQNPNDSPIEILYALKKRDENLWIDVTDADVWDLPLLVALGLPDSYQILGQHLVRDQVLPRNVNWSRIPAFRPFGKLDVQRIVELPPEGDTRPSEVGFDPDVNTVRYRGAMGRQRWTEDVYFHLLNTGHRLPPSAGSGSGRAPNTVGSNRVYIYVDPEEYRATADTEGLQIAGANAGFNREMWWEAYRGGLAVVTNGPILQPRLDGELPGFCFEFQDEDPVVLEIALTLSTRATIQYIDVIVNGRVEKSLPFRDYAKSGKLPPLEIRESGWVALKVVADMEQSYTCAMTGPFYVQLGGDSPLSVNSARFFLRWELERFRRLNESGAFEGDGGQQLRKMHEFAVRYWRDIYQKASKK